MQTQEASTNLPIEILKVIQGRRSALKLSQDLGYKTNQVHRWLTGHSIFTWKEFLTVCLKEKIPFQERLQRDTVLSKDLTDLTSLFVDYFPHISRSHFAKLMKVTPAAVTKWFAGKSSPPAEQIFNVLRDNSIVSFSIFVQAFLPEKQKLPLSLVEVLKTAPAYFDAYNQYPWFDAVVGLLKTQFKDSQLPLADLLANHFQLSLDEALAIVQVLEQHGAVRMYRNGQFQMVSLPAVDLSSTPDLLKNTLRFWTKYHTHRIQTSEFAANGFATYMNTMVSPEDAPEVRRLVLELMNKIAHLKNESSEAQITNITMFVANADLPFLTKI